MTTPTGSNDTHRLDALLDAAVDAIVIIDSTGRVTRFNEAAQRVFGYRAEEVLGRDVRTLMPSPSGHELESYLEPYHSTGDRQSIGVGREVMALRRDGSTFPIELTVGEYRTGDERGFVGILRDISERHMQESRLRRKAEQLRLLLEHAPTPVVVTDPAGHIQNANAASVALLGYELEELKQMRLSDLVEQEDRAAALADFEQVRGVAETRQREVRFRHRRGYSVPVALYSGCGRDKNGNPMLYIAELLDRSALHQATREADSLRDRLAHVSRLGMLGEMVSGIAHEVNQPLTAISTYASACWRMLDAGNTTLNEVQEVLEKIGRQAERAGQVIRGLRAMVRQRETAFDLAELNPLVEEVASLVEIDLRGTSQKLKLELTPRLPRFIGDGVQIQQVIMNLIRNAMEAMRESGQGEWILVKTSASDDDMLEIRVIDQGPGLAPPIQARLFEPFLTTKQQGMGLGLSICKSILQAHSGELAYCDRSTAGAEFLVRLPIAKEHPA